MKKEQIAFGVILALLGWMAYDLVSEDASAVAKKASKSRGKRTQLAEPELDVAMSALIDDAESSWSASGRNPYRAPREVEPLPPINLPSPPRSGLPTAPPQPVPGPDPYHRVSQVSPVTVVAGVELPSAGGSDLFADAEEEAAGDAATADPRSVPSKTTTDTKGAGILGLRQRARQREIQLLDEERQRLAADRQADARKDSLDKIYWENGDVWHGLIVNDSEVPSGASGVDKYGLKLKIDEVRANTDLTSEQRKKILGVRDYEVRFRRDRGHALDRNPQVLPTANIQRLEFAVSPVHSFELSRRLTPSKELTAHLTMVGDLISAGENSLARRHALWIADQGHETREVYATLSVAARRAFDYDVELQALHDGLEQHADDAELIAALGGLYSRMGLYGLAQTTFDRALAIDARNGRVNAAYGRHLVTRGLTGRQDAALAITYLRQASSARFELRSDRLAVLRDLGVAELASGNVRNARRYFGDVNSADPDDVEALNGLAAVAIVEGDLDGAQAHCEAALQKDPFNGRAFHNLGIVLLHKGAWADARARLHDAIVADPFLTAKANLALAYLYERVGDSNRSLAVLEAAREADPSDPEVAEALGRGFLLSGDYAQANDVLNEALSGLPDQFEVLLALGDAAYGQLRFEDSLRYYDRARTAAGDKSNVGDFLLIRRAQSLVQVGNLAAAKKALDEARRKKESLESDLNLAFFYYRDGNAAESLKRFQSVVKDVDDAKLQTPSAGYARLYAAAIEENLTRTVWTDHFNRVSAGQELLRDWRSHTPGSGVAVSIRDNRVQFNGTQRQSEISSIILQRRRGAELVNFESTLYCKPDAVFTGGVGVFTFRRKTNNQNSYIDPYTDGLAYDAIILAKQPDGRIAWRKVVKGDAGKWQYTGARWSAVGEDGPTPVRLGIDVVDRKKGIFALSMDGRPVAPNVEMRTLARTNKEVQLWVYTQAEIDRRVEFGVDDVRIVTRAKR